MILNIDVHLAYDMSASSELLLQIEVAHSGTQRVLSETIKTNLTPHFHRVPAQDGMGTRAWLQSDGAFSCNYQARVDIARAHPDLRSLPATAVQDVPGQYVRYLMPSRYCPTDAFETFAASKFGGLEGGACIAAIVQWISGAFAYVPGSSTTQTTAIETFVERKGICRDFAHVLICLARASKIPARFASVYAPDVAPPDFHAVAEVYLNGAWHLVDATGMATPDQMAIIGVGADAADVAFLNVYGTASFVAQSVTVTAEKPVKTP
ncbi:MAG: transglutaminase family protein [Pseudomonadota bacterium]